VQQRCDVKNGLASGVARKLEKSWKARQNFKNQGYDVHDNGTSSLTYNAETWTQHEEEHKKVGFEMSVLRKNHGSFE